MFICICRSYNEINHVLLVTCSGPPVAYRPLDLVRPIGQDHLLRSKWWQGQALSVGVQMHGIYRSVIYYSLLIGDRGLVTFNCNNFDSIVLSAFQLSRSGPHL